MSQVGAREKTPRSSVRRGAGAAAPRIDGALLGLLALALILRLIELTRQPIWFDEAVIIGAAQLDPVEHLQALLRGLAHWWIKAPLLVLLTRIWLMVAGSSEVALRLFSVGLGLLSLWPCFLVGRLLLGRKAALLALALLAANPLHIYYSQQLSEYTLLMFFSALSFYCWLSAEREGARRPAMRRLAVPALNLAALAVHPFAVIVPGVQLVMSLMRGRGWAGRWPLLNAIPIGVCVVGPILVMLSVAALPREIGQQISWIPPLDLHRVQEVLAELVAGPLSHGELACMAHRPFVLALLPPAMLLLAALGAAVTIRRPGCGSAGARAGPQLLAWLLAPAAVLALGSLSIGPMWLGRYLIVALPPLTLLVAAGLQALARWWGWSALVVGLPLLVLAGQGVVEQHRQAPQAGMRDLVNDLRRMRRLDDGLIIAPENLLLAAGYYLDRSVAGWLRVYLQNGPRRFAGASAEEADALYRLRPERWWQTTRQRLPGRPLAQEQGFERWLERRSRIWVAAIPDWPGDNESRPLIRLLQRRLKEQMVSHYPDAGAFLYLFIANEIEAEDEGNVAQPGGEPSK